ncbi:MAG: Asp-tRNA(Asn)/Glu-tRNA(Gln) amidotransferase subunit GatA [Chloroherpetonaceae bacterium]|nr:Asp-tRNA(Asn)/Glu-tRNA(Gln) amidotransferase subunit GatA [Chloroherpetonaceae bacterium]
MSLNPFSNYRELRHSLESHSSTVASITQSYLNRIEKKKQLNVYLTVFEKSALERAKQIDEKLKRGEKLGKLFGLPIAIKDNIAVKNEKLTCASKILQNFTSPYDATVIERLLAEDAIILGKVNLDEFAMGSSNENSAYGAVKNPLDETRVPGGSSGGSAASVASDTALVALGSDTGGSVRLPASFCGIYGIKPTYGRISRYGLVAFGSSLDQIGILAKSSEDIALVLEVIAGLDERDSTTSSNSDLNYYNQLDSFNVKGLKIGLPKEFFTTALPIDIRNALQSKIDLFTRNGAEVLDVTLPHSDFALSVYYILATAEASSNLARFDGARYGFRSKSSSSLIDMYTHSRSEGFGREVKRRIMLGTYVLSAGYYDAYYKKAQKVRRLIREDYVKAFQKVDIILAPTSPVPPFKFGEKMADPLTMYLADIYTISMNLAAVPALTVPAGFDNEGLPVGLQLIGNFYQESTLLKAAKFLEKLN